MPFVPLNSHNKFGEIGLVDGIEYQQSSTDSTALHSISNSFTPGHYDYDLEYYRPLLKGENVIVYVMEKNYSYEDFGMDDPNFRPDGKSYHTGGMPGRLKFLSTPRKEDPKRDRLNPVKANGKHGAKVTALLGGDKYGAAQFCTLYVVNQPDPDDETSCEIALDVVRDHFTKMTKKQSSLYGVMNVSRAFENSEKCRRALSNVLAAGIVVVGAAGNQSINFDKTPPRQLPEVFDNRIIIIGSLDHNGDRAETSNYGERVDYWVQGEGLAYPNYLNHGGRVSGTSFATAIASGVIACMLGAGQADYKDNLEMQQSAIYKRVRARLDEWAAKDSKGRKHLKNATNLTLKTPAGMPRPVPKPEMIEVTIDEQIVNTRAELTQSQDIGAKQHAKCEELRKKLKNLNAIKATGIGGSIFVPAVSVNRMHQQG